MATKRPLLFIVIIFFTLLGISFLSDTFPLPGIQKVNFISDVTTDKPKPAFLKSASIPLAAPKAGAVVYPVRDYLTYNGIVSYEAERKFALSKFITGLRELKAGKRSKVRIAYFGDSIIEGDLISEDLRILLQDAFGGNGVGFVPVTSIVSGFRETIVHTYSHDWDDRSFKTAPTDAALFPSGHYFISGGASTVRYSAVNLPHLNRFSRVYLLHGAASQPLSVRVNGKELQVADTALCAKSLLASGCNTVQAQIAGGAPVYGFSFEDTAGVYVDNYSFRGISGIELEKLNGKLLKAVQKVHDYDLIIFQYGPNLLFKPNLNNFSWYEKPMHNIIQKFKAVFSNASILVVSTADKAFRYNGKMETAVGVEPLLEAQNGAAASAGVNLWNLYHAMGGQNAMINWVEGDTAFARRDYTHFTYKGAKKIAGMLFTQLMTEYELAK